MDHAINICLRGASSHLRARYRFQTKFRILRSQPRAMVIKFAEIVIVPRPKLSNGDPMSSTLSYN